MKKDEDGQVQSKVDFTPDHVLEIFKRISNEDCKTLGFDPDFSKPEWMIISVLPVSPPPVRPSIMFDASRPGHVCSCPSFVVLFLFL